MYALALAASGRAAEARAVAGKPRLIRRDMFWLFLTGVRGLLAIALDDHERAQSAYQDLLPYAARPAGADTAVMTLGCCPDPWRPHPLPPPPRRGSPLQARPRRSRGHPHPRMGAQQGHLVRARWPASSTARSSSRTCSSKRSSDSSSSFRRRAAQGNKRQASPALALPLGAPQLASSGTPPG